MESDTEKASTDEAGCLISSASPDTLIHAPTDVSVLPIEIPTTHIPKVTSDSFISALVSDRETATHPKESRTAGPTLPEEESIPGEAEAGEQRAALPVSQSVASDDPQWSNVDLAEVQGQQVQAGNVQDPTDSCSLSSVATYSLAMEELYGADEHPLWAWVSGGSCDVDSHSQLNWFNSSSASSCELNSSDSELS